MILLALFGQVLGAAPPGGGSALAAGEVLQLSAPTVTLTIGQDIVAPPVMKFVQIEIAQVTNPGRIPLSFHVHHQPARGEKSLLGTFSLFPPDNPGTFIVATGGNLPAGGRITIALVPLAGTSGEGNIRVGLGRVSLIGDRR